MSFNAMDHLHSQSRLDIMFGSMFSGKSSALLRKLTQVSEMGLSALYINHGIDNRASTDYSTHSPLLRDRELNITTMKVKDLSTVDIEALAKFDVIGIDEAQFFDSNLIPFVLALVEQHSKYVIVVGLDGTFRREKFGHVLDLIPYANNVVKLHAYCKRCALQDKNLRSAIFTHYTPGQQSTGDTVIVGAEQYEALCRDCYLAANST